MAKIMLIEDDFSARAALERGLRRDQHDVVLASNSKEGLELARDVHINLIICDWMMPEMDGIEFCRLIKDEPSLRTIPIILVSGKISTEDMITAFDAGADDFLSKPFNIHELKARIRSGLRVHQLMNELKEANGKLSALNEQLSDWNDHLQSLSHQDALTELPNRRALEISLPRVLEQISERSEDVSSYRFLSVFMMDIDKFKTVNDTHGHNVGDAVLKIFSRRLISRLRPNSSLYRYAGDEFVCITPGMNADAAREYAEVLRKAISGAPFSLDDGLNLNVSTSIGGAVATSWHKPGMKEIIHLADVALYKAKRNGRDCLHVEDPPPEEESSSISLQN